MPSRIKVDEIAGSSGNTITIPSGQTLDASSGTLTLPASALSTLNASNLSSGTVPSARLSLSSSDLPTVPTTKGGTGLTTIGTANQVLRVNSGASALEYGTVSSGLVQTVEQSYRTGFTQSLTHQTFTPLNDGTTDLQIQITPTSASNKILIWCMLGYFSPHNASEVYGANALVERKISSGSYVQTFDKANQIGSNRPRGLFHVSQVYNGNYNTGFTFVAYDDSYSSTSQLTYRICVMPHASGHTAQIGYPSGHTDTNAGYAATSVCRLIAQEIA